MPLSGVMIDEDGTEEYFIPALGMFNEDQPAVAARKAGRLTLLGVGHGT